MDCKSVFYLRYSPQFFLSAQVFLLLFLFLFWDRCWFSSPVAAAFQHRCTSVEYFEILHVFNVPLWAVVPVELLRKFG